MIKTPEIHTFGPRRTRYCVMIGVFNEGGRFTRQLRRLTEILCGADIIIADGGSTDGATLPDQIRDQVHALVVDRRGLGLSGQYQLAMEYALLQGYEGIIMMDGNGKDGMDAVPNFITKLDEGADLVQGSRFLPGSSCRNTPLSRLLAIRMIFSPLMSLASGFAYTDAINGFKGVSRKLLEHQGFQPFRQELSRGYRLQYYINYRAPQLGARVVEIPVIRDYPAGKKILTKIRGLYAHGSILLALCRTCLALFNPRD
jgi:hypothetical protein